MNQHFFLSLLAMDVYNRGYNAGVSGLLQAGSIGTATLGRNGEDEEGVAQAAGFYAQAYNWNGDTILSYRGTDPDTAANALKDIINGWSSFSGIGTNSQFGLARAA